jgi:signal transduction histidine kinase
MRLSLFINEHIEPILTEWDNFARTLAPAANGMSTAMLRNHAEQILRAIASDIETEQSREQQYQKSRGLAPTVLEESAASLHGTIRQSSGFTMAQLTAEYRALRASVLRLWLPAVGQFTDGTLVDTVRFNEAIDQALAESVVTYSAQAARARDLFLAVLGHDLRAPLATMSMVGEYLCKSEEAAARVSQVGERVKRSAALMGAMVNDLLEYTRAELGGAMPMHPGKTDIRDICKSAVEDASAMNPNCVFKLDAGGGEDLVGVFDGTRLHQLVCNLLINAAQYRESGSPVMIVARGESEAIWIQVMNRGKPIPDEALQSIFQPLVQLSIEGQQNGRPATSLGLGLFVAREIAYAHGGTITAISNETDGTVFTVRLPKKHTNG